MIKLDCLLSALLLSATLFSQTPFKLKISGEVKTPLQLTLQDVSAMPHTTVLLKDRNGNPRSFRGVPLSFILSGAGVTMGRELRGENLSKYVLAKCADGYKVLFSLAELDSSFTDKKIILADSMDSQPLPEAKGPFRIVAEGEKKPARSCFQVVELIVAYGKE